MLVTIYYRKGCIKSRFLRCALRVMDWEVREADVYDSRMLHELQDLKERSGSGTEPLTPALVTNEIYSHEMHPLIEYVNERSPDGMLPADISIRLYARTVLHRVLRQLAELWPTYIETLDVRPILSYYDEIEELIEDLVRNIKTWRVLEGRPGIVEILFFAFLVEVSHHRAITNKHIRVWYKALASDPDLKLHVITREPDLGYHNR